MRVYRLAKEKPGHYLADDISGNGAALAGKYKQCFAYRSRSPLDPYRDKAAHGTLTNVRDDLLWRAVDEHGAELAILLQRRCDKAAAKRFFKRVMRSSPVPRKIVTDQLRSYPTAKSDIPKLASVKHLFVRAAARLNHRAENGHQPTRERERRMRGFRDPKRTQAFLSCFGPIRQHFALRRQLLRASL